MPRVSVIIPAFNAEAHIAEALGSVQGQTYDDWEVVVGDDGSTDGTRAVAASFGKRVKSVGGAQNAGPATARNCAIGESSGELLAFLDADDYWLPEYLEQQVGLFDARRGRKEKIGIVASNASVLTPDGFLPRTYMDYVKAPRDVTLLRLLRSNPIFISALSPQGVVDEAGGFCPEIFGAEDHDLWVRIVELGYKVAANRQPLAVYRVTPGSVSADPASMARAAQKVYRRALDRGNLPPRERRVAGRELRLQRAIELIAASDRVSYRRALRALLLFALVAVEHPNRWPSYARMVARRRLRLSAFAD